MTNDMIKVSISTEGLFHDWSDEDVQDINKSRSAREFANRAEYRLSKNFPYADVVVSVQKESFDDPRYWFHVSEAVFLHPTLYRVIFGPTRNGHAPMDSLHDILRIVHDGYMWLSMEWER